MTDVDHAEPAGDPGAVLLDGPRARAFWARRFQVPVEQVEAAVEAVGPDPARVAARLGKPWPYEGSGIV
ncbi:hypothetical protein OPKNFCMD_6516 [Methylobacterium crusticola]|uniref:DUF3606 domain-containing protein n=1 Tax=Methylobacterium crusticola TaxID=1697972 RepID=A0ABQ4R7P3_9HYPH|nr:DUF3606 domain-containing protein [Methylobacterium crusticola]GJD53738.1 hypothetical protein OPKNFCMD_6516 [Methylobacterium crusticola]